MTILRGLEILVCRYSTCHAKLLTSAIEYVQRYASKDAAEEAGAESEDDDDMSSVGSFGDDDDDEPAGQMDDV